MPWILRLTETPHALSKTRSLQINFNRLSKTTETTIAMNSRIPKLINKYLEKRYVPRISFTNGFTVINYARSQWDHWAKPNGTNAISTQMVTISSGMALLLAQNLFLPIKSNPNRIHVRRCIKNLHLVATKDHLQRIYNRLAFFHYWS